MAEQPDTLGYYGVLGRVNFDGARLDFRVYPIDFKATAPEAVVFAVSVAGDELDIDQVRATSGEEVEVSVFEDRLEMFVLFAGATISLKGKVASALVHYDLDDFIGRVIQLEAEYQRLNSSLHKATQKDRNLLAFTQELLRRAQIKSAASDEQQTRQAAAVSALERIIRKLGEN